VLLAPSVVFPCIVQSADASGHVGSRRARPAKRGTGPPSAKRSAEVRNETIHLLRGVIDSLRRSAWPLSVSFALRAKHYAWRTEQAYVHGVRRFILYHGWRHPQEMGACEIEAHLTHLAVAKEAWVTAGRLAANHRSTGASPVVAKEARNGGASVVNKRTRPLLCTPLARIIHHHLAALARTRAEIGSSNHLLAKGPTTQCRSAARR
jgi:hypothetical protein